MPLHGGAETSATDAPSSSTEFFGILPLLAVALFAVNNFVLKRAFAGVITGKLSDVLFCFFMPLFVSAILTRVCALRPLVRVAIGIALTGFVFTAVKTSAFASDALNLSVRTLVTVVGARLAPNHVDPGDLVALPMLLAAWLYARSAIRRQKSES